MISLKFGISVASVVACVLSVGCASELEPGEENKPEEVEVKTSPDQTLTPKVYCEYTCSADGRVFGGTNQTVRGACINHCTPLGGTCSGGCGP